jgi:hypothetical protein
VAIGSDAAFVTYPREREDEGAPLRARIIQSDMDFAIGSVTGAVRIPDVMTATVDAVSFDGARVGGARVAGRVGVMMGAVIGTDAMDLPASESVLALDAGLAVERDAGGATWRLAPDRGHWAMWDGRLVLDDRLTAAVAATAGGLRLRGEGFVARDHLLDLDGLSRATTGGATAIVERDLGRHTTVRVRGDGGRGFYASGAGVDDPRWGLEILATLTMHAGSR